MCDGEIAKKECPSHGAGVLREGEQRWEGTEEENNVGRREIHSLVAGIWSEFLFIGIYLLF